MGALWHLAEVDIGELRGGVDDPAMAEFFASLDPVNAIADKSPGFVWRLQSSDAPGATGVRPSIDPLLLINLSVWESLEALKTFVHRSNHADILRRRRQWMTPFEGVQLAMWWIPAGTLPTVNDGLSRLWHLDRYGTTELAFNFKETFQAPETATDEIGVAPVTRDKQVRGLFAHPDHS